MAKGISLVQDCVFTRSSEFWLGSWEKGRTEPWFLVGFGAQRKDLAQHWFGRFEERTRPNPWFGRLGERNRPSAGSKFREREGLNPGLAG